MKPPLVQSLVVVPGRGGAYEVWRRMPFGRWQRRGVRRWIKVPFARVPLRVLKIYAKVMTSNQ